MKIWFRFGLILLILIIYRSTPAASFQSQDETQKISIDGDQCLACHQENDALPAGFNKNDIHLQTGLSCAGCHGGNPKAAEMKEAMSPENGFIGVPARKDIPKFCGKCHSSIDFMRTYQPRMETDQVKQYATSLHGQKLQNGDGKVAECVSCHTSHAILAVNDPRSSVYPINVPATCNQCHGNAEYMKEYKIPTDQFSKYKKSVHGIALLENKDIGAPACNDCHGNHGAMPPGVASVSHVCGSCHVNNMNYFMASKMGEAFKESELHACEQCHGHHEVLKTNDAMIGVGEASVCTECHEKGDAGFEAAKKIHGSLANFVDSLNVAKVMRIEVQQKGMDDVDILFLLQEARQDLIHARTLVHSFDPDKIAAKTNEGMEKVNKTILIANEEIKDFHTRRRGFGVALGFIALLAIGLYWKIREMEKK